MMENTFNKLAPTIFNKKVGDDTVDMDEYITDEEFMKLARESAERWRDTLEILRDS